MLMNISNNKGFTLIELSVVLVIIGLIVGGVLVGRDLIRAAQIRSTLSQIEGYNSAVNTFRNKYLGIPGDLKYTDAAGFGFYTITWAPYIGYLGYGDGDGLIRSGNGATPNNRTYLGGEPFMFWRHLSEAGLVNGRYGAGLNISAEASGTTGLDAMNTYIPGAKLTGSTIAVGSPLNGTNYFLLTKVTSIIGVGAFGTSENPITASEAYLMDSKIDDGLPGTGVVFAIDGSGTTLASNGLNIPTTWTTVSAVPGCVASSAYVLTETTQSCSLRFKFQ
jgi:prepilin-type N-terminal cleavage/methylation domain-containing protein